MNTKKKITDEMMIDVGYVYCQHCSKSKTNFGWHLHHIVYRSEAPKHKNIDNEKNLIFLCSSCHDKFHAKKSRREYLVKNRKLWKLFPDHLAQ